MDLHTLRTTEFPETLSLFSSKELYQIRDACDKIESASFVLGLCHHVSKDFPDMKFGYRLISSIFNLTLEERRIYPNHGHAYFLSDVNGTELEDRHLRTVAAGFLACLIDDELIARGE